MARPGDAQSLEALILRDCEALGIECRRLHPESTWVILTRDGVRRYARLDALPLALESYGAKVVANKFLTSSILAARGIPVPRSVLLAELSDAEAALQRADLRFPVVLKPVDGRLGRGVISDIRSREELRGAVAHTLEAGVGARPAASFVLEEWVPGSDYRLLALDGELLAAAERLPARVHGDGRGSLRDLVPDWLLEQERYETERVSAARGLSLDHVPAAGAEVVISAKANVSCGGRAVDVTDSVHPHFHELAKECAGEFGIRCLGLDLKATDIRDPSHYAVIELNFNPSYEMHVFPDGGRPRDVQRSILRAFFA